MAAGRWARHAQVHLGAPGQASQPHLAVAPHRERPLADVSSPGDAHSPLTSRTTAGTAGQRLGSSWRLGRRRRMATSADVAMVAIRRLTGIFSGGGAGAAGATAD